jgi:2-iminobutanoate/2-iminopropanoate deaminase
MPHIAHNIGIASRIGTYADAVETLPNIRWIFTSGMPGLSGAGVLPNDVAGQAEMAWKNIVEVLRHAHMDVQDIVKVTQYLTRPEDVTAYSRVRTRFLGDARPASMLLIIPQLVWPEMLVEVEVIAAASRLPD